MRVWLLVRRLRGWRPPPLVLNAVLVVLALVGGVFAYRTVLVADATPTSTRNSQLGTVTEGTVTATATASSSSVQSAATANANFVTAGTVTEIDAKVGDVVFKGQVLAKVDPAAVQLTLNNALANLNAAQESLNRAQSAATPDAATIASVQATVTQAQGNVTTAQRAVDGTVLTAPMAGTVTALTGNVGGTASGSGSGSSGNSGGGSTGGVSGGGSGSSSSSASSGFIQIADLTRMQISGYFAEADATRLKVGQAATVTWSALPNARTTGALATIAPTASTQNGVNSYAVIVSLSTVPDGVRIGQTTTVTVVIATVDNVVRVPTAAVRSSGTTYTVQVVNGGTPETRTVEVGVRGDQFTEITSGLDLGEQVVTTTSSTTTTSTNTRGNTGGGLNGNTGGGNTGGGNTGGGNRPGAGTG